MLQGSFFFSSMPLQKVFKVLKLQSQSGESPAGPAKPSAFVGVTLVKTNPLSGRTDTRSTPNSCSTAADIQSRANSTRREEHFSQFLDLLELQDPSAEFQD